MIIPSIKHFFDENAHLSQNDTLLVAVSGGVDSVVLCYALKELNRKFAIAHVNFQLRGEDSSHDEEFVFELAKTLEVQSHIKLVDTQKLAHDSNQSIQMVARSARYSWFEQLCEANNYSNIATAHHQNDQAETVLLNLSRGSGIAGLRGILPVAGKLIRPLLGLQKNDLISYAEEHKLNWREDKSNDDVKYKRNLIRHKVLPIMEGLNPNVIETIGRSTTRLREEEAIIVAYAQMMFSQFVKSENDVVRIVFGDWFSKPGAVIVLNQWIVDYGFVYSDAVNIIQRVGALSGKQFYSKSHRLVVDRDQLVITPLVDFEDWHISIGQSEGDVQTPLGQLCIRKGIGQVHIGTSKCMAHVDAIKLGKDLSLRTWREGDVFQPLGMQGKKKLSDFMIDCKIPVNLKKRIPLLCSGSDIVWVIGHRLDDRFKITESTQEMIELEWI